MSKRKFTFLAAALLTASVFAQAPQKMSYQAVIRNSSNALVTNTQIGMQIIILQGSVSGLVVYTEKQTPTTNANGLVCIEVGAGTVQSGDFTTIDWANGPYFIKTKTDLTGGTSYTITGTSQLLSVPFALLAKTAESISGGIIEIDPSVPSGSQIGEMQYWDGSEWGIVSAGNEGQVLTFSGGVPKWKTPLKSGDITNPTTGKIWMDKNLGASQVATSRTDAAAYGDLYQWGRATDGHEKRTSGTTTIVSDSNTPGHADFILASNKPSYNWRNPQNDNLWQGVTGINNPCPSGYRLPTAAEWEAERQSWSRNDAKGAYGSPLKLPVAGYRLYSNGSINLVGSHGWYWSSTVNGVFSQSLYFKNTTAYILSNNRASGISVRCLKD